MESLEEVADREEAERQQSLRDLEQLYEWLQQFEDPPPAPQPPPPQQFRNGGLFSFVLVSPFNYIVRLTKIECAILLVYVLQVIFTLLYTISFSTINLNYF